MPIGKLKIFDIERGFGFIRENDGSADIFLHVTSLFDHGVDPYTLSKGDVLIYEIGRGRDGRAAAINVRHAEPARARTKIESEQHHV